MPLPKDPVTETGLSELAIGVPLERKVMMPAGGKAALLVVTVGSALLGGATNNPLIASFAVLAGLLIFFNLVCQVILVTAY